MKEDFCTESEVVSVSFMGLSQLNWFLSEFVIFAFFVRYNFDVFYYSWVWSSVKGIELLPIKIKI